MKKIYLFLIATFTIAALNSCKDMSEDIYQTKCKIQTISSVNHRGENSMSTFIYEKKDVTKILYENGNYVIIDYAKDRTAQKVTEYGSTGLTGHTMQMAYEGKKISEISYFDDNQLIQRIHFYRNEEGIITRYKLELDIEDFMQNMKTNKSFYNTSINRLIPWENIYTAIQKANINMSKGNMIETFADISIVGGNITQVSTSIDLDMFQLSSISNFTFDDKNNPYRGLCYALFDALSLNSNNITSANSKVTGSFMEYEISMTTSYTYNEKDFPVKSVEMIGGSYVSESEVINTEITYTK